MSTAAAPPAAKRKAEDEPTAGPDAGGVKIVPLGAASEVGRSCFVVEYRGKRVMLDCGIHPGKSGLNALPYFDEVDLSKIDVALITHFHLDHCAALPYLVGKTKFKGRILMTHPTKHVYHTLLKDFVKVSRGSAEQELYSMADLEASMKRIEVCDFHQTLDIGGVRVTAHRAGHVLGAAMFLVDIEGMKLLYTGDYSRVPDRHMAAADLPRVQPHIVIVESTYGTSNHSPRAQREALFLQQVKRVVERGGRCLLPVVALGRAQELLLMLEDFWSQHPELARVPIYQASGMARKALNIYQAYIDMMNDDVQKAFQTRNPFNFKYVQHLDSARQFNDTGPCVVMATPSMLQSGLSRDLFEAWVEDRRNGVIICDFAVQGTLAREVLDSPSTVLTRAGTRVPLRMTVSHVSFSAHADCTQTREFVAALDPPHVMLVHGEREGMTRLRRTLEQQAGVSGTTRTLHTPRLAEVVEIPFRPAHRARVVGSLAERPAKPGGELQGVLVRDAKGSGAASVMRVDDLPTYTKLHPGRVLQRQAILLETSISDLRYALELTFEGVSGTGDMASVSGSPKDTGVEGELGRLMVGDAVTIVHRAATPAGASEEGSSAGGSKPMPEHIVVEWHGGAVGDMLADAVIAVILRTNGPPQKVAPAEAERTKALEEGDEEGVLAAELRIITAFMEAQFGEASVDVDGARIAVRCDDAELWIDHKTGDVHCNDAVIGTRVHKAYRRVCRAMAPCALDAGV